MVQNSKKSCRKYLSDPTNRKEKSKFTKCKPKREVQCQEDTKKLFVDKFCSALIENQKLENFRKSLEQKLKLKCIEEIERRKVEEVFEHQKNRQKMIRELIAYAENQKNIALDIQKEIEKYKSRSTTAELEIKENQIQIDQLTITNTNREHEINIKISQMKSEFSDKQKKLLAYLKEFEKVDVERETSCQKFNKLKAEFDNKMLQLQQTLTEIKKLEEARKIDPKDLRLNEKLEEEFKELTTSYQRMLEITACIRQKISQTQNEINLIRNEAVFKLRNMKEFSSAGEEFLQKHKEWLEKEIAICKESLENEISEKETIIACLTRKMDNLSLDIKSAEDKSKNLEATTMSLSKKNRICQLVNEQSGDHQDLRSIFDSMAKKDHEKFSKRVVFGKDYMGSTMVKKTT